ncbi:hypothetical protein Ancab_033767 [Ancistrocladus abbreviatus]
MAAGARSLTSRLSGRGSVSISRRRRSSGRPIPKRGRVKIGIVVGLAHSVASIFSLASHRGSTTAARASMNSAARIVSQRISKLPIPKRGQVKVAIVLGLSHTLAALRSRSGGCHRTASYFPNLSQQSC